MRRVMMVGAVAAALSGCVPPGLGGVTPSALPGDMVPDPSYRPNIGDRVVLYGIQNGSAIQAMPLLKDMTAFDIFERTFQANDSQALAAMEQRGDLCWTPPGTRVLLLATHDRTHTGSRFGAEVRALDGPYKDQSVWVPLDHLVRLHPAPPPE